LPEADRRERAMPWLVKTEPGDYSFDDLLKDRHTVWDGVSNPQAVKNLKAMAVGDRVFVYHSGSERRIVGWAEVPRAAASGSGRAAQVEIEAVDLLATPVSLADLKGDPTFADSPLVRQGRLSVVPLSSDQVRAIERLAGR
jgi:predicted RNA-binding protein with PUA-like domain